MAQTPAISGVAFPAKVAVWVGMLGGGTVGAYYAQSGPKLLLFQLLAALGMVHGVELCHQALHHLGFRTKWLNYVVGVLLGAPMLVSFSGYQDAHLRHHKTVGTPNDSEFFDYGNKEQHTLYDLVVLLMMPAHYTRVVSLIGRALLGWDVKLTSPTRAVRMRFEYLLFALLLSAAGVSMAWFHSAVAWRCWLMPLIFFATPLHALVELPEHHGCRRDTPQVFLNTRTIRSSALMAWFTNGNNFHVEHHFKPYWPIEKLPALHEEIKLEIHYLESTYLGFYHRFFRDYFRGSREIDTVEVKT